MILMGRFQEINDIVSAGCYKDFQPEFIDREETFHQLQPLRMEGKLLSDSTWSQRTIFPR